jgi:hypothetical protein
MAMTTRVVATSQKDQENNQGSGTAGGGNHALWDAGAQTARRLGVFLPPSRNLAQQSKA